LIKRPLRLHFERQSERAQSDSHFTAYVRKWLIDWADENDYNLERDGLVVHTTLDHDLQQAAERAAELSKQLLSFARRGKRESTPVDLNTTVLEVVSLLTRTIDKNITVTEQFNAGQATVLGDAGQLQQVVLNLAINARDAMPDGGTLTFRTWRRQFTAEQLVAHPGAAPGTFVALSVSDTGRASRREPCAASSSRSSQRRTPARAPAWDSPWSMAS